MKKINSLFSVIFFVFFTCNCFNFRDSFVYRHKKKIIGCTTVVILLGKIYFTNQKFDILCKDFKTALDNLKQDDLKTKYAFFCPQFKDITSSYFLMPKNSKKLHELIQTYSVPWTITFNTTTGNIIDLDYEKN